MTLHWYDHVQSALTLGSAASLSATLLVRRRERKTWGILLTYSLSLFVLTAVCTGLQDWLSQFPRLSQHRTVYAVWFYTYWCGEILQALLGIGVIYEAVLSLPLAKLSPRSLRMAFGVACAIISIGAVYFSYLSCHDSRFFTAVAFTMQRSLAVLWCAFAASVVASVSILGLQWTSKPLSITSGFLVQSISYFITAHAAVINPHANRNLTLVHEFVCIGVIISWTLAINAKERTVQVHQPEILASLISSLGLSRNPHDQEASTQ